MTELRGASILIVGASGGLGQELAKALHDKGALLTLAGRNEARLNPGGLPAALAVGDISTTGTAQTYIQQALMAHQRIDAVIYAAGAVAFGALADETDEVTNALWQVNTLGWMSVLRAALPALTESAQAGRSPVVVTLSGVVAETPTAGLAAYSAVKSALHAYGVAAGRELRRLGIRLIDARPGHTETELSKHPLAGVAPTFPVGLSPAAVAHRIVLALESDEKDLPSTAFHGLS